MANEASIIELFGEGSSKGRPIRFTVADATALTKGTVMVNTDPRTMVAHSAADQPFCGILAAGKAALDTAVSIAVYTDGIFDMTAAAAGVTAVGAMVATSGTANMTTAADAADLLQGSYVGHVLESQANDERSAVRVNR